jgi:ribosomal protein S18 acetylase RimI-like enzyme
LWPRSESHFLLARRATTPDVTAIERGDRVRARVIATVADAGMATLEAFATESGFPAGWAADMLAEGAVGTLAVDEAGGAVAMAWATRRAYHIEEIDVTLDPGGGTYLFGDFVAPAFRGRGLQRWLVGERVRAVGGDACTIVHPSNVASLRSYEREGFVIAGRFTRYRWARRTWARCRAGGFELLGGDVIRARWG